MPTNVNEITSAEWSLSLRGQGEVEQGFDDINQCIRLVVSTQRGTDPLRPDFGCDFWTKVDTPSQDAIPEIINDILSAIATWETRIIITDIKYQIQEQSINLNILWILQGNKQRGSAAITLDFAPQRQTEAPPVIIAPIETPALSAVYVYPDGELSWTFDAPTGVSFQILRSDDGTTFEQVATVVSGTDYTDSDLSFDTEFSYQIRAVKGSRVSGFSNIASIQTIEPYIEFASSAPLYVDVQKTGTADVVESAGGITKVYLIDDDPDAITSFFADDAGDPSLNAGITGVLDFGDTFTGLRTIRARNQDFTLLAGAWVRNAGVDIDVSNSVISLDRVTALIDNIILANGGTITDNGTSYTGVAGETHAGRLLGIGSLVIDIEAPENAILYEKIIALEGVGWTITTILTICNKTLTVNTYSRYYLSGFIEKTRELISIDYISGDPLTVKLYDTELNASAGGLTGLLADGYTAVDTWLRDDTNYNAWVAGTEKGIRFEAIDTGSTGNISNLRYKATPTDSRPCGENSLSQDYRLGNAQIFDGAFNYNNIAGLPATGIFNNTAERAILFEVDIQNNNNALFAYGNAGGFPGTAGFLVQVNSSNTISFQVRLLSGERLVVNCDTVVTGGKHTIIITKGLSWRASDIEIYVDGVQQVKTVPFDGITAGDVEAGSAIVLGRRSNESSLYFQGKFKQFEILDFKPNALQISDASGITGGSFRAAGIAHNSGNYIAAVDFEKENTENPTSYADTPLLALTAFGGATYEDY